jgi:hypothetical protein
MSLTRSDTLSIPRMDIKRYVGFMEEGNTIEFSPSEGFLLTILKREEDIILQKISIHTLSKEETTVPGVLLSMISRLAQDASLPLPETCMLQGAPPRGLLFPRTALVDFFKALMEAYPTNELLNPVLVSALQYAIACPTKQKREPIVRQSVTHVGTRLSYDFSRQPTQSLFFLESLVEEEQEVPQQSTTDALDSESDEGFSESDVTKMKKASLR